MNDGIFVGNGDHGDGGELTRIQILDLGRGHMQSMTQSVEQAAHDLAFVLYGYAVGNFQFEYGSPDYHDLRRPFARQSAGLTVLKGLAPDLLLVEGLDDIALLPVVEAGDADPAFRSLRDLVGVLLEMAERIDASGVNDLAIAQHTD